MKHLPGAGVRTFSVSELRSHTHAMSLRGAGAGDVCSTEPTQQQLVMISKFS